VSEKEELFLLFYLHDIGKLTMPVDVWRQEQAWSDHEQKKCRRHRGSRLRIALTFPS